MASEWESYTIEELASSEKSALATGPFGSAISAKFFVDAGFPVIRGSNLSTLTSERMSDEGLVFVSDEKAAEFKRSVVRKGDLIFTCWGTINQVGLIDSRCRYPEYIISNKQMKVTLDTSKADPLFVYYYFSSPAKQREILQNGIGAAVPGFNLGQLRSHTLRLPPLSLQKKISSFIDALDSKITLNRQINQTLEQMAQTLFKSWFVDFDPVMDNALDAGNPIPDELQHRAEARKTVRESEGFKPLPDAVRQLFPDAFEESELGWVPKGWEYQSFGSLLASTIGGDWGKDVQDEKHTVQSRIVRGTDIPDLISGQLSSAPLRWVEPKKLKSRQIERGDIIIEVSGGSPKQPTGRSIFMTDSMLARLGSIIEPASFCRRFKPSSFNIGLLASLHLQKIYADGKTWEYQNQSTGIANFQTKFFLEAEMVLIPSEPVLEAFCRIVTPLVEKSQNNEQIALAKLRDTLLPKLISGELRLDEVELAVEQEAVSAEQQNER